MISGTNSSDNNPRFITLSIDELFNNFVKISDSRTFGKKVKNKKKA